VPQRAERHARRLGVVRVVHDRRAAGRLDGLQPGGAVVEVTGQHHPHRARAAVERDRAEQRVHGRAAVVLLGAAAQPQARVLDVHVPVGRRHVDASGQQRHAVDRVRGRQGPGAGEQLGQDAAVRADGQHHEQRGGEIDGQRGGDGLQGLHAAGGGADGDDPPGGTGLARRQRPGRGNGRGSVPRLGGGPARAGRRAADRRRADPRVVADPSLRLGACRPQAWRTHGVCRARKCATPAAARPIGATVPRLGHGDLRGEDPG
jgi:hypothetical protein